MWEMDNQKIIIIEQNELEEVLKKPKTLLLDVREVSEFQDFNIGGMNIPPHEIPEKINELIAYKNIVVACSNGTRSEIVAKLLQKKLPKTQIYHLEEGVF
jgi:rhodanese-related sulfurtransferase